MVPRLRTDPAVQHRGYETCSAPDHRPYDADYRSGHLRAFADNHHAQHGDKVVS